MPNLFYAFFPNSILLCGMGAICASVEMLIFVLAAGGLFVMGFLAAVAFVLLRCLRSQDSKPLSILATRTER